MEQAKKMYSNSKFERQNKATTIKYIVLFCNCHFNIGLCAYTINKMQLNDVNCE